MLGGAGVREEALQTVCLEHQHRHPNQPPELQALQIVHRIGHCKKGAAILVKKMPYGKPVNYPPICDVLPGLSAHGGDPLQLLVVEGYPHDIPIQQHGVGEHGLHIPDGDDPFPLILPEIALCGGGIRHGHRYLVDFIVVVLQFSLNLEQNLLVHVQHVLFYVIPYINIRNQECRCQRHQYPYGKQA